MDADSSGLISTVSTMTVAMTVTSHILWKSTLLLPSVWKAPSVRWLYLVRFNLDAIPTLVALTKSPSLSVATPSHAPVLKLVLPKLSQPLLEL